MIKKMTKYTFVVFHTEVSAFLERLQGLGVVDITRSNRAIDETSRDKFGEIAHFGKVIGTLNQIKESSTDKESKIIVQIEQNSLLKEVDLRLSLREELKLSINEAKNELSFAEPWGNFNINDLSKIDETGFVPHFYICSKKRFSKSWEEEYPLFKLNEKNDLYFVVLSPKGELFSFPLTESKFPERTATEIEAEIKELESRRDKNEKELLYLTKFIPELKTESNKIKTELELYLAKNSGESGAENTIAIFEGFAPVEENDKIIDVVEKEGIYYIKEEAKAEDNPPIKLKNNFFSKLYEPIGELYMMPRYGEHDLTPYFAPFYMLFFGLCLGDMGYGAVLLAAGIVVGWKVPKYSAYGKLVAWLGLGAIIMPALNGTFFGGKIQEIIPMSDNMKGMFFSDLKMFWFAIIFGLVQIIFARIIKVIFTIKDKGFGNSLGEIGWILLITWCSVAYAAVEAKFSYPAFFTYIFAYGGLVLIILFSSDSKNIVARIGKGVVSLYDITGVFGDMLSYIRLFGLGTAGGILGLVVNSVAMQMSGIPYVGWVFTIIMLLFGHTAVLLLSCLGAFVHPMRLTFVEFYKNVGFEGGGREYRPLSKEQKE
jgi:V/A-type H+/Na+-transporting ATPase subunit I